MSLGSALEMLCMNCRGTCNRCKASKPGGGGSSGGGRGGGRGRDSAGAPGGGRGATAAAPQGPPGAQSACDCMVLGVAFSAGEHPKSQPTTAGCLPF